MAPFRRNNKKTGLENGLSELVPGYTAPLSLTADGGEKRLPSLQSVHRQSIARETRQRNIHTTKQPPPRSFKTGKPQRKEKIMTAGEGWFHMRSTPMTPALQQDLAILHNRNYLDPKRFYKSSDTTNNTTVQLGTVIEGPTEFYSSRLTKKQRRNHLTDELLAGKDSAYALQKYKQSQQQKMLLTKRRRKRGGR